MDVLARPYQASSISDSVMWKLGALPQNLRCATLDLALLL
jgi:hypothetical protein